MHTSVPAARGPGTLPHDKARNYGRHFMIEARGLVKRYGPTTAVDNLSFDVRPGTWTGFLAPNGAGKSTTTRMFPGPDRPDAGTPPGNATNSHPPRRPPRHARPLPAAT